MSLLDSISACVLKILTSLYGEMYSTSGVPFQCLNGSDESIQYVEKGDSICGMPEDTVPSKINSLSSGEDVVVDMPPIIYNRRSAEQWRWPAEKQLSAVVIAWGSPHIVNYFWTDGSYSDFNIRTRKFIRHYSDASNFYEWGWPVGKQLSTVVEAWGTPKYVNYFWTDGSYSDFDTITRKFTRHYNNTEHFTSDWPVSRRRASQ